MDRFFDGAFLTFGLEVISFAEQDQEDRLDPLIYVFPRMTKCTFHKFGTSGEVEKHDALCLLPLNIVNEKVNMSTQSFSQPGNGVVELIKAFSILANKIAKNIHAKFSLMAHNNLVLPFYKESYQDQKTRTLRSILNRCKTVSIQYLSNNTRFRFISSCGSGSRC